MKKIKNMVNKGGVADIVTLMIIVGLVVVLIIGVVLPMANKVENSGDTVQTDMDNLNSEFENLRVGD